LPNHVGHSVIAHGPPPYLLSVFWYLNQSINVRLMARKLPAVKSRN